MEQWHAGLPGCQNKDAIDLGVPKEPHRMGRQIVAFVTSHKFADSDAGLIGGNGVQKHQPVGMNA
jgi:hypothetical protein